MVHFFIIWYNFFPVLVCRTEKNLATLVVRSHPAGVVAFILKWNRITGRCINQPGFRIADFRETEPPALSLVSNRCQGIGGPRLQGQCGRKCLEQIAQNKAPL
jgi:hypothetical protein